ncbi:SCL-interrupting locus protein isoform X1 [Pogona vitticeps]
MDLISSVPQNQRHVLGKMVPFSFPPSKIALWNPAPIGESTLSHLSYYRNPKLIMTEKTLRLAHRHAKQSRRHPFTCFLVGTLAISEDDGVLLTLDRFDPGREVTGGLGKIPTASLPGDFLIPCTFSVWGSSSGDVIAHSSDDFHLAFKILQQNLNSQDFLDPSKLLTLRVHISSTENMDNLHFDFHWAAVTVSNVLKCTPVKSVPIIPTALARNLSSHMNITQVQGSCKYGYLTMDQTRKLLLVLESDPKAYTLPLIGIWLSGVSHIYSPQVWAYCLRYLFSSSVQKRVPSESGSFLIALYSLKHNSPEFYECLPCGGSTELGFQLLTSKESLHLFKNVEPSDKHPIQFELSSENKNAEMEFFSRIMKNVSTSSLSQSSTPSKLSISDQDSGVEDDASPRPFPCPQPVTHQITEIQPLVPELSIVFDGTSTESVPVSKHTMITDKKSQPSLGYQPAKVTCPAKHQLFQLQHSDNGKQLVGGCTRVPSPRQLPSQSKQRIPLLKPCKGSHSLLQQQSGAVESQAKKSSGSNSSSSLSPPCSGSSPNTSSHHHGTLSEKYLSSSDAGQKKELSNTGPLVPSSRQSPVPFQSPWPSPALSSPHVRKPLDVRIPVQGLPCCPACVCSCQLHGHVQYSPINPWQGMCLSHTTEVHSSSAQESTQVVFHQNIGSTNSDCHPVCASSSPVNPGCHGNIRNSSNDNMPGTVGISSGNSQPHAVCSTCSPTSEPKMGTSNEMMELSSDVYRILTEQDRQIKLLQAQIQRLLEAQNVQACSTSTIANSSLQSQKQLEFVAMETHSSPVLHMKKSVSIAVSTGASLYLNPPLERNKESIKQDDVEISSEDINISINTEKDTSQTSIASSLKVVDIPSFVDSVRVAEEGPSQPSAGLCAPGAKGMAQTSLMSESVSMCLQSRPLGETYNNLMAINEQKVENVVTTLPNVQPGDEKFYQDILGQVNHFLKESSEENESSAKCTTSPETSKSEGDSAVNPVLSNKDSVLQATLKQLKQLGVNFDSPHKMNGAHKVENASIMACINPEAVIPGLNYISFANVGLSGLTPNGVDLSMEANAIALKYLSESQLSQLSLSHSSQKNSMASSVQTLLQTNTDKTLVGFGLISPTNMSFATKKYMRKYGLLQSCDSSEEEEEQQTDDHKGKENFKPILRLDFNPVLEGFACWKDPSERTSERQALNAVNHSAEQSNYHLSNSEGPMLRNITNTVLPLRILHKPNENSAPFLKDLKPKMKLLPGKAEFTQHPAEENLDIQIVPETPQTPIMDHLKHADNMNSVGTFLDVQQLRQLPKLF